MRLQDLSWLASFLGNWFSSLISEREWWFSDQREDYLCLVTYTYVSTAQPSRIETVITFMNVLEYPFPVTYLGSWERMDVKLQVSDGSLA
jgi:hypothetical protein